MTALAGPASGTTAESIALRRLLDAHAEEAEGMTDKLRRSGGIAEAERVIPDIQALLDLDDERFRDLVARHVKRRVDVAGLGHPAVLSRWHDALTDLGSRTFAEIGLEATGHHVRNWFAVPDACLPCGGGITRTDARLPDSGPICEDLDPEIFVVDQAALEAVFLTTFNAIADMDGAPPVTSVTVRIQGWREGHGVPAAGDVFPYVGWWYLSATAAPSTAESGCLSPVDPRAGSELTAMPGLP